MDVGTCGGEAVEELNYAAMLLTLLLMAVVYLVVRILLMDLPRRKR